MEVNEKKETVELDLRRLLHALWHRAWLILLVGVLCGSMAFGYAWFFMKPTYAASVKLYVNNNYAESPGFSSSQLNAAQQLANTYMVIMGSRKVLDAVAEKTDLGYNYAQLKSMISAGTLNETEVFQVYVVCYNYQHAALIANAIADVLPEKLPAVVEGSSVRVVEYAVENPNPVGPNYEQYLTLGALLGMVLTIVVILVITLTDTTIDDENYLIQAYGNVPLLAVIPSAEGSKGSSYKGYYESEIKRQGGAAK